MSYRFDSRSEDQFKADIKSRTQEERKLFLMWLDFLEASTGSRPDFTDTGCGQTGEFLEESEVTLSPDFEVEGYGKVEVKFSKPHCKKFFHLKASQVKSYHANGVTILMINGSDDTVPQFTMLRADALKVIMDTCKIVPFSGFGAKMSYKIKVDQFIWRPLK